MNTLQKLLWFEILNRNLTFSHNMTVFTSSTYQNILNFSRTSKRIQDDSHGKMAYENDHISLAA